MSFYRVSMILRRKEELLFSRIINIRLDKLSALARERVRSEINDSIEIRIIGDKCMYNCTAYMYILTRLDVGSFDQSQYSPTEIAKILPKPVPIV